MRQKCSSIKLNDLHRYYIQFVPGELLDPSSLAPGTERKQVLQDHLLATVHAGTRKRDLFYVEPGAFKGRLFRARLETEEQALGLDGTKLAHPYLEAFEPLDPPLFHLFGYYIYHAECYA